MLSPWTACESDTTLKTGAAEASAISSRPRESQSNLTTHDGDGYCAMAMANSFLIEVEDLSTQVDPAVFSKSKIWVLISKIDIPPRNHCWISSKVGGSPHKNWMPDEAVATKMVPLKVKWKQNSAGH